jgi:NTE family protein
MDWVLHELRSRRVGLALSGGSVRGLAHIGVIKALTEAGIRPAVVAGTSVGSLVGAALAAGMDWRELAAMARSVFWPSLLNGRRLERLCTKHLPETFGHLRLPFAAVATAVPSKRVITITTGRLASAISASCAIPRLRRPVARDGLCLLDGGLSCVLPAQACRELGAEFVIASDVWEWSSLLRFVGCHPTHERMGRAYPSHYRHAVRHADLLIQPGIPFAGYVPGAAAVERMIAVGEQATHRALARLSDPALRPARRRPATSLQS